MIDLAISQDRLPFGTTSKLQYRSCVVFSLRFRTILKRSAWNSTWKESRSFVTFRICYLNGGHSTHQLNGDVDVVELSLITFATPAFQSSISRRAVLNVRRSDVEFWPLTFPIFTVCMSKCPLSHLHVSLFTFLIFAVYMSYFHPHPEVCTLTMTTRETVRSSTILAEAARDHSS